MMEEFGSGTGSFACTITYVREKMMWILNAKDRENVKGMLQKREFCGVGMIIIINPVYSIPFLESI